MGASNRVDADHLQRGGEKDMKGEIRGRGHWMASMMFDGPQPVDNETEHGPLFINNKQQNVPTFGGSNASIDKSQHNTNMETKNMFVFSEEEASGKYDRVEPGRYEAQVYKVKINANGLVVSFRSTETEAHLCNDFYPLSEKSHRIVARKLKVLGVAKKEEGKFYIDDDGGNLMGLSVTLTLVVADDPKYVKPDFKSPNYGYEANVVPF